LRTVDLPIGAAVSQTVALRSGAQFAFFNFQLAISSQPLRRCVKVRGKLHTADLTIGELVSQTVELGSGTQFAFFNFYLAICNFLSAPRSPSSAAIIRPPPSP
jgi:hypothetical protein